ncbi:hypothetical protein PTSG_08071 [Salpingoeca rosetta]|uniref:Uncharacterized protein n=1 Tax=Salpingoeca rosetta (strain ATCC 50818 / BSB-021) TaxID=946362 RepID=F2UHX1_SALR5|nr:uncharacterized protein PTSG_08071 [Salpingoeca rosetta]EGD76720.1 hypothetical protein PTSG_08071 [Salpingoeca rosetta]|eukprot:XP_004991092.1 hypothetical protein PTSG_08071 [Salpingoeca rosetta]
MRKGPLVGGADFFDAAKLAKLRDAHAKALRERAPTAASMMKMATIMATMERQDRARSRAAHTTAHGRTAPSQVPTASTGENLVGNRSSPAPSSPPPLREQRSSGGRESGMSSGVASPSEDRAARTGTQVNVDNRSGCGEGDRSSSPGTAVSAPSTALTTATTTRANSRSSISMASSSSSPPPLPSSASSSSVLSTSSTVREMTREELFRFIDRRTSRRLATKQDGNLRNT